MHPAKIAFWIGETKIREWYQFAQVKVDQSG